MTVVTSPHERRQNDAPILQLLGELNAKSDLHGEALVELRGEVKDLSAAENRRTGRDKFIKWAAGTGFLTGCGAFITALNERIF